MVCPNCGSENEASRKFCDECGTPFARGCPACGVPNRAGARFCGECGGPLAAGTAPSGEERPAIAGHAPEPVSERRLVTVLFADLVGFTGLAEGRDAEDTRELLTRYFELARDTVERYGGTVEKFIGDAVMAVWGTPTAREDDAERAVRAALDLVAGVRFLVPGLDSRAGVLTGEAAVTLGAAGQGMVAGDLVNTASRLQAVAVPGTVLVGEATERAVSRAIVFEPAGEQLLKGKTAPVPVWRALRVVAELRGRGRSEVLEPPFVGREDELRLLKDLFHATSREKRTRLVSVSGQAGIGKSRLAWEFSKYSDGLAEEVWWHEGRCPAYGDGVTFWALGEMARRRAGLVESDDERTTRERIAAAVAEHVPDDSERRWVERALLVLLGLEPPPPGGREELFAAWRTFFERMAASGICVLVFEDLQWADQGLLEFIDHLVDWSRGVPIFVVTLARPELLERRADWGSGKRSFVALALEPLSEPAMRELLAGLVPGLPGETARAIVERAGGIPLYAVETVRMLVEEGKLTADGAAYRPTGDLGSLAVPETLHALIASRLDALDPADRSLLQDAAVLGQSFTLAGLAAVSGMNGPELEPHLRTLIRREFLTLNPDPRSPERGRYVFVQSLVREVAYGMLARRDRKARHLAAARWLEAAGDEEQAGALAAQYLAAYRNAPEGPEADALAVQARITLRGAATRAAALGSPDQAIIFLEQALAVTSDPAEQADLLERTGDSASHATRYEVAETHLRRAADIRSSLGDRSGVAHATARLGSALINMSRLESTISLLEPAAAEFADLAGDPGFVALESQLARALFLHNEGRRAIEVCDRVLVAAERGDLVDLVADTLITRGSALCGLGRTYEGVGAIRAGIELAESAGWRHIGLRGRANLSGNLGASDWREALEVARGALDLARNLGIPSFHPVVVGNAASAAIEVGEWDWALRQVEAALEDVVGDIDRAILGWIGLWIRSLRGDDIADEAERLEELFAGWEDFSVEVLALRFTVSFGAGRMRDAYEAAMGHARAHPMEAVETYPDAAFCALWERDRERAIESLSALEEAGIHGRVASAHRRMIRAGLAALEGRSAEALVGFREALAAWRDLGCLWRLSLTAIVMATVLGPQEPEVRAAAEEAREILARLGAKPFLERLEALMARAETPATSSPAT